MTVFNPRAGPADDTFFLSVTEQGCGIWGEHRWYSRVLPVHWNNMTESCVVWIWTRDVQVPRRTLYSLAHTALAYIHTHQKQQTCQVKAVLLLLFYSSVQFVQYSQRRADHLREEQIISEKSRSSQRRADHLSEEQIISEKSRSSQRRADHLREEQIISLSSSSHNLISLLSE